MRKYMTNLIKSIAKKIGCDYTDQKLSDEDILEIVDETMDFTMTGMDISYELQKLLNKFEDKITNGMSENEKQAYDLGVENSVKFLEQLLDTDYFVFDNGTESPEENDLGTIIEVMREINYED